MNRPLFFLAAASLSLCALGAEAQEGEASGGRYYIAPMVSIADSQKEGTHDVAVGAAVAVGASVIPHLGVEIVGDYLRYTHLDHSYGAGLGMNAYLSSDNQGLFLHADVEGGKQSAYNAGLGFDRPILGRAVSLRLEALWHKEGDVDAEALFRVGLRVPFGAAHGAGAMAAEPVTVVPLAQPDSPPADSASSESADVIEAAPGLTEEPVPGDATNAASGASTAAPSSGEVPNPVSAAVEPPRTKRAAHRPRKAAAAPAEPSALPMAESGPAMAVSSDPEPAADASLPATAAAAVPAPPEPAADEALAPTEPAPAPKASDAPGAAAAQETASVTSGAQAQLTDSDDAPTEPAPKPR